MKYHIVGIGELLWDVLPGGREMGGAPANFAHHIQELGGRGIVVSAVGEDEAGKTMLDRLRAMSLTTRYIAIDREHPTGTVTVSVDAEGKPSYTIHENVAWDYIPCSPELEKLAAEVDAVCFGLLGQRGEVSRETIQWFVDKVRPGALRMFDVTLRPPFFSRETIETSLKLCNVLKLNDDELEKLAEIHSYRGSELSIIEKLSHKYRLRLVAFTRGERGSILYSDGEVVEHPGHKAKVVDTVGAGDSFGAALVMGMLIGKKLDVINDAANRIASFVCSRRGATPELPGELKRVYD
jgi:fructokinase